MQDAAAASAEVQKQQQSKQQGALDSVSQLKSDLWELWQQVGGQYQACVTSGNTPWLLPTGATGVH